MMVTSGFLFRIRAITSEVMKKKRKATNLVAKDEDGYGHITKNTVEDVDKNIKDHHEKIERLHALSSLATAAIGQRDAYSKWHDEALKRIRLLEAECRTLERERDAARAVAADLMEQLRQV
jgi:hypothetical protein